jgi:triphosphoribosyl-dephospho-CoA synthase
LHDVRNAPQVTLFEMMHAAQSFDRIAWQYTNAFHDVIEFGMAYYAKAMQKWQNPAWATTALYLGFLTIRPDTHVTRKHGEALARSLMEEAQEYADIYWAADNVKLVQKRLMNWDAQLKQKGINPGTSADLTVATLLAINLV